MFCILGAFVFIDISSPIGRFSGTRNQNGIIVMSTSLPLILLGIGKKHSFHVINPLPAEWALRALIDFTLSNARRFYSSKGNPLDEKGLTTSKTMSPLNNSSDLRVLFVTVEQSELSYTDWLCLYWPRTCFFFCWDNIFPEPFLCKLECLSQSYDFHFSFRTKMFCEVEFNVLRKKTTKNSKLEFATEMIICGNQSNDIKNIIEFIAQNTSEN